MFWFYVDLFYYVLTSFYFLGFHHERVQAEKSIFMSSFSSLRNVKEKGTQALMCSRLPLKDTYWITVTQSRKSQVACFSWTLPSQRFHKGFGKRPNTYVTIQALWTCEDIQVFTWLEITCKLSVFMVRNSYLHLRPPFSCHFLLPAPCHHRI